METPKKQITARIPESIYLGVNKKAEEKGVTFTEILIEALEKYLGADLPGLCPSCHTQNDPDDDYCSKCSTPLTSDTIVSLQSQIDELKEQLMSMDERIGEVLSGAQEILKMKGLKK